MSDTPRTEALRKRLGGHSGRGVYEDWTLMRNLAEDAIQSHEDHEREIARLEAQVKAAMSNLRGNYEAFSAMRNDINQVIGTMPSAEASLRNGPEMASECADITQAVATHTARLEARLREAHGLLRRTREALTIGMYSDTIASLDADIRSMFERLAADPKAEEADRGHDL